MTVPMNLSHRSQRLVVLLVLFALVAALALWPTPDRESDSAHAGPAVACDTSPTPLAGLVNGNTLSLGNGTTITPCIAKAPIHMRIGYSDGDNGGVAGGGTAFTTDGISFPDGKYTRLRTDCGLFGKSDSTIAKPTILQFADGSQSAGPSNVTTYTSNFGCNQTTLYAQTGWPTGFDKSDDKMLVHMRLKNLQINRNAFLTVVPQAANVSRFNSNVAGTGEYKLTFIPATQSSANWNIGEECVYTDLWLTADTYIKTNILGIATTVGSLAGDSGLWGSILGTIAGLDNIPGLELDGWVYYMNTNKGTDCTGSPTTLNLPNTNITVTP